MKFLCGGCSTKYQLSDEKVRGKILTIRCQKCGSKIVVRESGAETVEAAPAAQHGGEKVEVTVKEKVAIAAGRSRALASPGGAAGRAASRGGTSRKADLETSVAPPPRPNLADVEWFVAIDGVQHGPFPLAELIRKVSKREVLAQHYAWHQHMTAWTRVREVAELAGHVPPAVAPAVWDGATGDRGGGEVVDFAARLAERERTRKVEVPGKKPAEEDRWTARTEAAIAPQSWKSEGRTPPPTVEDPARFQPTVPSAQAHGAAGSKRAPVVLPEVLPPPAEPPRSEASREGTPAPAGSAPVVVPPPIGIAAEPPARAAAALDFSSKDDIFANIPRVGQDSTGGKESTRFFVAAAGIQERRKRARLGLVAGAAGGIAVLAFLGAWATGMVEVRIERLGNPFSFGSGSAEAGLADADDGLDKAERAELRARLGGDAPNRRRGGRRHADRGTIAAASPGPGERAGGPRGGEPTGEHISFDVDGSSHLEVELPEAELPVAELSDFQPAVDHPELSADAVRRLVVSRQRSIGICYQTSLKGNEALRGRLELAVSVKPSGDVAKVTVVKKVPGSAALADCIAAKIEEWKFPAFSGDAPTEVRVPFVLEKM